MNIFFKSLTFHHKNKCILIYTCSQYVATYPDLSFTFHLKQLEKPWEWEFYTHTHTQFSDIEKQVSQAQERNL